MCPKNVKSALKMALEMEGGGNHQSGLVADQPGLVPQQAVQCLQIGPQNHLHVLLRVESGALEVQFVPNLG
jgi:hypothetical protein